MGNQDEFFWETRNMKYGRAATAGCGIRGKIASAVCSSTLRNGLGYRNNGTEWDSRQARVGVFWQGEKCQRWWCQHRENSQNHHLIIFPPPYKAGVYWIRWQEGELWIEETLVEWKWRGHHTRQRARGDKMPLIAVRMFGPTFPSPIPQRPRCSYTCSWHLHPRKTICYGLLDVEIMSWIFAHQIEHVYVQYWQFTTFSSDLNSSLRYYAFTFMPVVSENISKIDYRTVIWYTIYFRMIRGLCKCFNEYWSDEFQHSQSHSKVQ